MRSKRMAMDDSMKAISLLIAEACVNSVIGSISASTFSNENAQLGPKKLIVMGQEWTVSYIPNPSWSNQRKLEDGVKPPLVLMNVSSGLVARQPRRLRKDVPAERCNRFARWRTAWPRMCCYAYW